jgi:hypothetical protein
MCALMRFPLQFFNSTCVSTFDSGLVECNGCICFFLLALYRRHKAVVFQAVDKKKISLRDSRVLLSALVEWPAQSLWVWIKNVGREARSLWVEIHSGNRNFRIIDDSQSDEIFYFETLHECPEHIFTQYKTRMNQKR